MQVANSTSPSTLLARGVAVHVEERRQQSGAGAEEGDGRRRVYCRSLHGTGQDSQRVSILHNFVTILKTIWHILLLYTCVFVHM